MVKANIEVDNLYPNTNLMAIYSTLLSGLLIWKDRRSIRGVYHILAFLVCLLTYLAIGYVEDPMGRHLLLAGPMLLPFTFWLFSRSLFNDAEMSVRQTSIYAVSVLVLYYGIDGLGHLGYTKVNMIVSRFVSICFVLLALKESLAGRHTDLDEERIQLRKYFTYAIGLMVLVTLLVELSLSEADQESLRSIQRSIIVLLNTVFLYFNFSVKSKLLSKRKKKTEVQHPELIEKIQLIMTNEQLYRQEKLTIGLLAEVVQEQEYKVRRAINQDLGYRNFIDFISSYRIKEAIALLKDRSKADLTILEIAYQTGFNSIGPFNRTFKSTTGFTPTEFRKRQMEQ